MLTIEDNESIFNTRLGEAITELNRISLVDLDKDGDPTMHSLIRAFVKCNIQDQDPLRKQLLVSLKRLISDAGEDQLKLKKIIPHAEFAFRSLASDNNDKATSRDEAIGLTAPLVVSALRLNTPDSFERARSSCTATIGYLETLRKKASSDWTARLQTILAGAYLNRGNTYSGSQEKKFAEDNYSRAIELCEECENLFGYIGKVAVVRSIAYANRAQVYLESRSLERGMADVESLLELERITKERLSSEWPISDHSQLARSLGNLAFALADQANVKLALSVQQLLVSIVERISEPDWASLNALGVLYLQGQEWHQAEVTFRKCEEAAIKSKSNEGLLKSRNNLAISLRKQERLDEAERVCLSGVEMASRIGELAWECQCLGTLANVLMDQGHRAREAQARDRIREIRRMIGDRADENLVDV
jgi:Flp pilus assembly protein TadD